MKSRRCQKLSRHCSVENDENVANLITAAETGMQGALSAAAPDDRRAVLRTHLTALIAQLLAANPDLQAQVRAVRIASDAYNTVRDAAVREAHVHKMSLEYTNQHPVNEFSRSTIRFIYSHQPTEAPILVTFNFATSIYNLNANDEGQSRFRDLQFSAQMDRRLPSFGRFSNPVLTFAGYYQWMKQDALLSIPESNLVPGTGIALPSDATILLGTKGHNRHCPS